ncbi:EthD family reductase [Sphingomonas sp. TZW2008]|uniref:EthD family reductase n=1 Tax=Sphingomonas sp. TZW2008 TaxID=1917973 RepID=UPI000A2709A0|nr:EthD family reductase [Sphingomonas sp. TZW2008]
MIVSVLYPNHEGAKFDTDYYKATHAELAKEIWNPERVELIEGQAPGGGAAPFAMIAHFHFSSPEAMATAFAHPRNGELHADVANCTDIAPTVSIGKAL